MKCPCRNCTDRHVACHDRCDKYKAWKQNYDNTKEKRDTYLMYKSERKK